MFPQTIDIGVISLISHFCGAGHSRSRNVRTEYSTRQGYLPTTRQIVESPTALVQHGTAGQYLARARLVRTAAHRWTAIKMLANKAKAALLAVIKRLHAQNCIITIV